MRNIRPTHAAALALGIVSALSAHAQLVTNGDFETGDFTGWTTNSAADDPWAVISASSGNGGSFQGPYSGTFFASAGCVGASCIGSDSSSDTNYIYEDLNTVANATYTVSFAFSSGGSDGGDGGDGGDGEQSAATTHSGASFEELLATFGGVTVVDLVDVANPGYVFYSENMVASSTTTRLEFQDREDPSWSALDGISVTLVTATPEPGTILLGLGAGLLSLIQLRFRKTRSGPARTEN